MLDYWMPDMSSVRRPANEEIEGLNIRTQKQSGQDPPWSTVADAERGLYKDCDIVQVENDIAALRPYIY